MSLKTKIITGVILFMMLSIIVYGIVKSGGKSFMPIKQFLVVKTSAPVYGEIAETVSYIGSLEGENQIDIYSKVAGKFVQNIVYEGQWVNAGAVVALIDRDEVGTEYNLTQVVTPISGIVTKLHVLDRGTQIFTTMPLAQVANSYRTRIYLNISEEDFPKVQIGQKTGILVDSYPNKEFTGYIIMKSPIIDVVTHTSRAVVSIDNSAGLLAPGMFAKVKVFTTIKNALKLPNSAIVLSEEGDFVFINMSNKAFRRDVKTGIRTSTETEILSGIMTNDQVVYEGTTLVSDGISISNYVPKQKMQEEGSERKKQ